jgi:hypothetical protein
MSELHAFFKGSDVHMGVFYPNGYLIAIFRDLPLAQKAETILRESGQFREKEVLAVPGNEVIRHDQEHRLGHPFTFLMTALSRFLAAEAVWTDRDLQLAREGCALLAVHCPSDNQKRAAWRRIEQLAPLAARHYSLGLGGIEHLAGDRWLAHSTS